MSRTYYNQESPFLFTGGESAMDCLQLRQSSGPFHYLIHEQAKSLAALQELQHEVGALLEFRDLVIETFPNLRSKMASSTPTTLTHTSNIPVAVRRDWEPGVRVRRKLNNKDERSKKTESAIQDSGFSTETSSKETHSASSAMTTSTANPETEDELWNLLDVIHRKGTRLKNEVEALQGTIRESSIAEEPNFQRTLFHASADDVRQLKRERDLLLDRVAEMEAEVLAGRMHTSRLQEDLENLLTTKHDLEEQLKAVVSQRGQINSRIHDLHLEFVAKSAEKRLSRKDTCQRTNGKSASELDSVFDQELPKVRVTDTKKFEAILKENDPLILQKHLLTTTVQNQVLQEQLETAVKKEVGLAGELDKTKEENEDLKFQLEDKNIELEGTKARVRVLEQLQKPSAPSPDVIPTSESPPLDHALTRSEITTASMKAMSPFPLNLQLDHSSSTESAHDQAESARRKTSSSRPSKIPLKSYAAPKPPTGGNSSSGSKSHNARSRSGDSLNRSHSAQSWRNKSEANSLSKSRNGSLTNQRDSLGSRNKGNDSLSKARESPANSFGTNARGTLRKGSAASVRRSGSVRDSPDAKISNFTNGKFRYRWILSSYNSEAEFPDSLNETSVPVQSHQPTTSGAESLHSANIWSTSLDLDGRFYDSIDSNVTSSFYRLNGEKMADCDSLELQRHFLSDTAISRK